MNTYVHLACMICTHKDHRGARTRAIHNTHARVMPASKSRAAEFVCEHVRMTHRIGQVHGD